MRITSPSSSVVDVLPQQEQTGGDPDQAGKLTPTQFLNFCMDIQHQPGWRVEADKCVDYYDGNQLDAQTMQALMRKGMGPLIMNIIAPIVNVVLGMEAKTRTDWRVAANSDDWQDVAEALSARLHETERETRADRACSDGYAGQIKAGLNWVEVSRNANPFQYPYRCSVTHRREIFWDWRDQTHDLNKARYLVRKRWYDVDQAITFFPQAKNELDALVGDRFRTYLEVHRQGLNLANAFDQIRGMDLADYEDFRSIERRRVCLYEVWYRNWVRGWVLRLPNGDVVELNMKNPVHVAFLARGIARPEQAVYSKMRSSIWAGPFCLADAPAKNDYSPYIPFWGYREDRTGAPYGLIRAMISPQDEVNARRQKLLWLLGAKRVEMDSDALDREANTVDTMLQEVARPDAVVVLNPNRANKQGGFKVETDFGLAQQQFEIMKDSEEAAQRVAGVFNAMLGRETQADSGVAINSLVEQGATALAEINDNYRFARRLVGERLLDLIRDDLAGVRVSVAVGESGKQRVISLNNPSVHEQTGIEMLANNVQQAKVKVALEDVPSTPAYRQQQLTMITEVMKGLPPDLQAAIAPFYFEATDLQKRREMADAIRKRMGIVEPRTPEEAQQMQAEQDQQKALQQRAILLDLEERAAKIAKLTAEADKLRAEATAGGMDEQARASFDAELREIEAGAQKKIDELTAQLVRERALAQMKQMAMQNAAAAQGQGGEDDGDGDEHGAAIEDLKKQMDAISQSVGDQLASLGQRSQRPSGRQD